VTMFHRKTSILYQKQNYEYYKSKMPFHVTATPLIA